MPTQFEHVYLESTSLYLPGEPINNTDMDAYIAPINRISGRIKARILAENGIKQRHYAIDAQGKTTISHAALAAAAVNACMRSTEYTLGDVGVMAVGSSGGDALMPGFANVIHGELGAPPMSTLSSMGVCAAGVSAILHVAQSIELGAHEHGLAVAAEMPSRMFKKSRFEPAGYALDFDAHFLRWMLSDGAGAMLFTRRPTQALRLKLKWVHQQSFAGDYPVCMQLGLHTDKKTSFLDYASTSEAEQAGAMAIRQDIRLLPHLFDVSIHEYVKLVKDGWVHSDEIDHFLCHYSSDRFIPVVEDLLSKAGLSIPRHKWFSNLSSRGNTGSASIYIMLAEFMQTHKHMLKAGEKIFCFIPESGQISAAYMLFEVADVNSDNQATSRVQTERILTADRQHTQPITVIEPLTPAPHDPMTAAPHLSEVLKSLATIWHDYRSQVWRSPVIRCLTQGHFTVEHYRNWTAQWVPQVREGSIWMREAIASLAAPFAALGGIIETHASEEQHDFKILYQNYLEAGGTQALDDLKRNPGGEALNSYLHSVAGTANPLDLLGAIYIIEGTGQRIVPALLPMLKAQVALPASAFKFLDYHAGNDEHHLARWLQALELALALDASAAQRIIDTAANTAALYLMQFKHIQAAQLSPIA